MNEKQLLAHLEVIERNMREHAISPQEFNEFRIDVFGEFRNEVDEKFNKVDARFNQLETNLNEKFKKIDDKFSAIDERFNKVDQSFNSIDKRLNKIEVSIKYSIYKSTGILISFIALLQFFNK